MKECFEYVGTTPVLSAALVTVLVLLLAVFPILPIGGQMLDVMAGYTCPDVVAAMESYGEQGRRVYAWSSGTLDMLFPVVYVGFLAGFIYRFRPTERLWRLAYLPVAAGVLDLCENVLIILMLSQYPEVSARQVGSASLLTLSKGYALKVCVALAVVLAIVAAIRHARRRLPYGREI